MTDKKIWLVTGAGRGLGIDIAQKALAAGHAVVATGRKADRVLHRPAMGQDRWREAGRYLVACSAG